MKWMTSTFGSDAWIYKTHANAYSKYGTPDVIACIRGKFWAFECKRPGEDAEPVQSHEARKIVAAGGKAFCVQSLKEVQEILTPLLGIRR